MAAPRFDFAKATIKHTGDRPMDDTQRAVLYMQGVLNLTPLRRETVFVFPSALCAAGAALTARPLYGVSIAPRRLVAATVTQTNAVAKAAAARIYKIVRYRGTQTTTVASASTVDNAVMAFVPYSIPVVADNLFQVGDSAALVLEQVGVAPAVNECAFTLTWEATP